MSVVTPYGGNPKSIPNEDSLSFEFDETNLFSLNRFPGYDRWDGGPKLNYGLRSAIYGPTGGYSELLVGQSLRAKSDDTFAAGSGLSDQWSDYVARLRSEEHTSELQSLMRISYAVFCLKKKKPTHRK